MRTVYLAALLFCCATASAAQPSTVVAVPSAVDYADGVGTETVRACDWNTRMGEYIANHAKGGVVIRDDASAPAQGRSLRMQVTHAHSTAGGRFSGPKWATIHGELLDGATVIGSFDANRTTTRGITACRALERVGEEMGKDIAKWLRAPSMNAKLGNAK